MKKISESLSAKLWFYYSIVILLLSAVVVYYFTNKQQESITKYRKIELVELSRNIAMGVELSLEDDNYQHSTRDKQSFGCHKSIG